MRLAAIRKVMDALRAQSRRLATNNLRINEWVDDYLNRCMLNGNTVDILTQWCLSKDLETRYRRQGNKFIPLGAELDLFKKGIPEIVRTLTGNGLAASWYVTFNGSFLEGGRVEQQIVETYVRMITGLAQENDLVRQSVIFLDWEREVLGKRPEPSPEILDNFSRIVPRQAFEIDFTNLLERVKKYPDALQNEEALRREAMFKIACEGEEGRYLLSAESPFPGGEFILIPLEFPERYVFFSILAPEFQKRIVAVLRPYPWRMDSAELKYEI